MKKSDLKNGMVVETKSGEMRGILIDNNLMFKYSSIPLSEYNEDLKSSIHWFDIFRIYAMPKGYDLDSNTLNLLWERKEEILTSREKQYLGTIIKPFRNKVVNIRKYETLTKKKEFIAIDLSGECIELPCFEKGQYYKNMVVGKEYSLKELGL